jgi:GAF domain-containing protein
MFNWLRRLVAPPLFVGDEDKTRIAAQLNVILWTFAGVVVVVGTAVPFLFATQWVPIVVVLGVLFLLTAGMLLLMHRGQVRLAGGAFSLGMWLLYAGLMVGTGGLTSPVALTWIVTVIIAGLLLSRRAALGFAGLSALAGLGIFYLESNGLLPPPFIEFSSVGGWALLAAHLGITATLLNLAMRGLDDALGRARRTSAELERERGQLERVVAERTRDLAQRSNYLEATIAVAREAASTLNLEQLLSEATHLIGERFDCYHVGIFLLDDSEQWAVLQAASSEGGQKMLARGHRVQVRGPTARGTRLEAARAPAGGIVPYVIGHGVPHMALDVEVDALHLENPDLLETRSELTLPLRARGEIIGALDLQSRQVQAFSEEEVTVLGVLSDQVALAIDNARLFEQARTAIEAERRAVGELTGQAWELLRSRAGAMAFVRNREGLAGPIHPVEDPARQVPVIDQTRLARDQAQKGQKLSVPIKVRDQVIGVMQAQKPAQEGEWTPEQIALFRTLTEQLAVALESARLYEDTQRRAAEERLVGEVTGRFRETLDVDTVLKTAAQEIRQALGLSQFTVRLATEPDTPGNDGGEIE